MDIIYFSNFILKEGKRISKYDDYIEYNNLSFLNTQQILEVVKNDIHKPDVYVMNVESNERYEDYAIRYIQRYIDYFCSSPYKKPSFILFKYTTFGVVLVKNENWELLVYNDNKEGFKIDYIKDATYIDVLKSKWKEWINYIKETKDLQYGYEPYDFESILIIQKDYIDSVYNKAMNSPSITMEVYTKALTNNLIFDDDIVKILLDKDKNILNKIFYY